MNRAKTALLAAMVLCASAAQAQWNTDLPNGVVYTAQKAGIGTSTPMDVLHLQSNNGHNLQLGYYSTIGSIWSSWATVIGNNVRARRGAEGLMENMVTHSVYAGSAIVVNAYTGIQFHTKQGAATAGNAFSSERMVIDGLGNVGIGTPSPSAKLHVEGSIYVSGNINAKFQDLAEWVPATTELAAGTVVVLNGEKENEVMASSSPYDTTVAGVVSAQPGLILGDAGANKALVATTGRVLVRVDATKRAVRVGDLLVTGEKPGTAMVSTPVEVSGIAMHRPGTIIGKALQPLPDGEGEVLVLLSLQ